MFWNIFASLIWSHSREQLSWPFANIMGISSFNKLFLYEARICKKKKSSMSVSWSFNKSANSRFSWWILVLLSGNKFGVKLSEWGENRGENAATATKVRLHLSNVKLLSKMYFEKWNWSEQWENKHISTYHCSVSIQIFTFTWKDKKSNNLCLCFKWMHPPWYWQALNIASKIAKLRKWRNPRWNLLLLHIYYSSQTSILGKSHKTHFVY